MFDLEKAISDWRRRMLAAGIETPVPLDELESHLREEIERQLKLGLNEQIAFEISVRRVGQPEMLKGEFKKIGGKSGKTTGIFAVLIGAVIILRILTEHPDAAHLRKNEQAEWLVAGAAIVLFGLSTAFFIKLGDVRELRLWKLVGITYSTFAVWISMLPIILFLTVPRFSAAVGLTDRILTFTAVTMSLLSVLGWRWSRGKLPVIQNQRIRTIIGIICCLLGPVSMAFFWLFIIPHSSRFAVVPVTWAWTAMAILGGVGYGLTEAACRQTEVAGS